MQYCTLKTARITIKTVLVKRTDSSVFPKLGRNLVINEFFFSFHIGKKILRVFTVCPHKYSDVTTEHLNLQGFNVLKLFKQIKNRQRTCKYDSLKRN